MVRKIATALLVWAALLLPGFARAELQTVEGVDLQKYMGYWYTVAHIPIWYELSANCACAKQALRPTQSPGVLDLTNSCNENDAKGDLKTIHGLASVDASGNTARFNIDFHSPIHNTYWIIGLDANYRYAVVSDAFSVSLYILSRTPVMPDELYKEALALAAKQMDTSKLVPVDQKNCKYPL